MALLFASMVDDPEPWRAALARALPDLAFRVAPHVGDPSEIRFALVFRPPPGLLARLPNLQAIFSLAAGVEDLLADPTLPDVPLCRMVDPALTRSVADYVLWAALRVHRGVDRLERAQAQARWAFTPAQPTSATTVGILGLGQIGRAVATRLSGEGFAVIGWSRRPQHVSGVRSACGAAGLRDVLAAADIVVSVLPTTPATRDLIDRSFLAAMKPGAHVVNVGRGEQVVDLDLIAALDAGHLAGATLDVFRTEPLPPDHPFWRHPLVRVTPHVAGFPVADTAAIAVADNVRRCRAGQPLRHVVDRALGY